MLREWSDRGDPEKPESRLPIVIAIAISVALAINLLDWLYRGLSRLF